MKDIYLLQVRAVFLLIITDQDKTGMGERQLPTGDPVRFPWRLFLVLPFPGRVKA